MSGAPIEQLVGSLTNGLPWHNAMFSNVARVLAKSTRSQRTAELIPHLVLENTHEFYEEIC